jgi:hypothetical protein
MKMNDWATAFVIVISAIMFVWFLSWLIFEFGPAILLEILVGGTILGVLIVLVHGLLT